MACFHIFLTPVMVHHSGGFDLVAVTSTMYYYIKEKGKQPSPTLFIMERAGAN